MAGHKGEVLSDQIELEMTNIYRRLTTATGQIQNMSREEINLAEVVEDVSLQALRRVQINLK